MASSITPTRHAGVLPATEVWADPLRRACSAAASTELVYDRAPEALDHGHGTWAFGFRCGRRRRRHRRRAPTPTGWTEPLTARLALDRRDLDREASAMRLNARHGLGAPVGARHRGPRARRRRPAAVGPGQRAPGRRGAARADRLQPAPGRRHPHRVRHATTRPSTTCPSTTPRPAPPSRPWWPPTSWPASTRPGSRPSTSGWRRGSRRRPRWSCATAATSRCASRGRPGRLGRARRTGPGAHGGQLVRRGPGRARVRCGLHPGGVLVGALLRARTAPSEPPSR